MDYHGKPQFFFFEMARRTIIFFSEEQTFELSRPEYLSTKCVKIQIGQAKIALNIETAR